MHMQEMRASDQHNKVMVSRIVAMAIGTMNGIAGVTLISSTPASSNSCRIPSAVSGELRHCTNTPPSSLWTGHSNVESTSDVRTVYDENILIPMYPETMFLIATGIATNEAMMSADIVITKDIGN